MPKVSSFITLLRSTRILLSLSLLVDYTYTRNKFDTDSHGTIDNTNMKEDVDPVKRQEEATRLIVWFNHEDKYSQGSFILSILQWCESYLIFTIALTILSLQDIDCK